MVPDPNKKPFDPNEEPFGPSGVQGPPYEGNDEDRKRQLKKDDEAAQAHERDIDKG